MKRTSLSNKLNSAVILLSTIIAFTGCAQTTQVTESSATETNPVVESEIQQTQPEETNIEDSFIVETIQYTNPLISSDIDLEHYEGAGSEVLGNGFYTPFQFGFDNKYSVETLRNITYEYTGVYYDDLTLSDVNYFQGFSVNCVSGLSQMNFSYCFSNDYCCPYTLCFIRAILIDQGLRFGIDEIPYSYIEQRFPYFMDLMENYEDLPTCMLETNDVITDISEIGCNYDYDYLLFGATMTYNLARATYIYNNPYGSQSDLTDDVFQVRDAVTGNNVLVPTEEQYYQMMEDITSITGCENVDIAVVETPENFYEAYGCYPEDVLNPDLMYEENIKEVYLQNNPDSTRFD